MTRFLALAFATLMLTACSAADDNDASAEFDPAATAQAPISEPAAEAPPPVTFAESSPFASDTLHDLDLPPPGHLRLVVAGQSFEGPIESIGGSIVECFADDDYNPRTQVKMFRLNQPVISDDGSRIEVTMARMMIADESAWNRHAGHENDIVEVTVNGDQTSRLTIRRIEPGHQPFRFHQGRNAGDHELPLVRFRRGERLEATAVGELHATGNGESTLSGLFELAVVCP